MVLNKFHRELSDKTVVPKFDRLFEGVIRTGLCFGGNFLVLFIVMNVVKVQGLSGLTG